MGLGFLLSKAVFGFAWTGWWSCADRIHRGQLKACFVVVEINPRDYRAWYGLGQTYELLELFSYATYYYGNAQKLRLIQLC